VSYVFLSHNSADKPQVIRLARELSAAGVAVWLDVFELKPGDWLGPKLDEALKGASVVLVCIGEHGAGPWHDREIQSARAHQISIHAVCLPGWQPQHGRLGLDNQLAFNLHAHWDRDLATLIGAMTQHRVGPTDTAVLPDGPFDGSPYPGIDRRFGPEHAAWFFGREHETAEVMAELRRHRWVWLVGNSGSGKSSIARAGVMSWWPRAGIGDGLATVFEPTEKATEDLTGALARICAGAGHAPLDLAGLAHDPTGWSVVLRTRFGGNDARTDILVVVDQAEQIFGEVGLRGTCATMLDTLWRLASDDGSPARLHVLVVLRADWLQRALNDDVLKPILRTSRTQVTLSGMDAAEVQEAITVPARRAAGAVDRPAVDVLVEAACNLEHGLPLLQMVLQEAWRSVRSSDRMIRLETVGTRPFEDAIGRIVGKHDTSIGGPLTDEQLDTLVPILVELDDRNAPRRRWAARHELDHRADAATVYGHLDVLVAARVVVSLDKGTMSLPEPGWQLAHEAVLTAWSRLAVAITRRSALLQQFSMLAVLAKEGTLLIDASLKRYEPLRDEPALPAELREFLDASIAQREQLEAEHEKIIRESQERSRRRTRFIALAVALTLLAVVTGFTVMWRSRIKAEAAAAAREAEHQRGASELQSRRDRAVRRAYQVEYERERRPELAAVLARDVVSTSIDLDDVTKTSAENSLRHALSQLAGIGIYGHAAEVIHADFSADERWLATVDALDTVMIWEITGTPATPSVRLAHVIERAKASEGAFLDATGNTLITVDGSGARVWPLSAPSLFLIDNRATDDVKVVAKSGDGKKFFAAGTGGDVALWSLSQSSGGETLIAIGSMKAAVTALTASWDGSEVFGGAADGTVAGFRSAGGNGWSAVWEPFQTDHHSDHPSHEMDRLAIDKIDLDENGHRLAATSTYSKGEFPGGDSRTRGAVASVWSIDRQPRLLRSLDPSNVFIGGLALARGTTLLANWPAGDVRIYDETAAKSLQAFAVGTPTTASVVLRDGTRFATAHLDGTVRIWNTSDLVSPPRVLRGHTGAIRSIVVSPKGTWVVTAGEDHTARLFGTETRFQQWYPMQPAPFEMKDLRTTYISGDGCTGVGGHEVSDSGLIAWNLCQGGIVRLQAPEEAGDAFLLGRHLRKWVKLTELGGEIGEAELKITLLAADGSGRMLFFPPDTAFSSDGRWAVYGISGGWVVHDLSASNSNAAIRTLPEAGDGDYVFSPNGDWLFLTVPQRADRPALLWRIGSGGKIAAPRSFDRGIGAGWFDPHSEWLFTHSSTEESDFRAWRLSAPDPFIPLSFWSRFDLELTFSNNGRWVMCGEKGRSEANALLELTPNGPRKIDLPSIEHGLASFSFSSDSRWLTTVGANGGAAIHLWDLEESPLEAVRLVGAFRRDTETRFSPQSRWLVLASDDDVAPAVFDLSQPDIASSRRFLRQGWPVPSQVPVELMAFTRDDSHIALVRNDRVVGTSRVDVWTLIGPSAFSIPIALDSAQTIQQAAFTDDGAKLMTVGAHLLSWPMALDDIRKRARLAAGRNLTWSEWRDINGDDPYQALTPDQPIDQSVIRGLLEELQAFPSVKEQKEHNAALMSQASRFATQQRDAAACEMVCILGAVTGTPREAISACERAVELTPQNLERRAGRGIVRAMTGNYEGAIEDIEQLRLAAPEDRPSDEAKLKDYDGWIDALRKHQNPFDAALMRRLLPL
jgi:WD40 repeat protein